jgi:Cytochrome P460
MKRKNTSVIVFPAVSLSILSSMAGAAQDKYTVKALNGVAFSEFRGYESWQDAAVSQTEDGIKAILGNPGMINAYKEGIPGNGKPFPDGVVIVKIEWSKKKNPVSPYFRGAAGHPKIGLVHREGFQEIPGHEWVGIFLPRFCRMQHLIHSSLTEPTAHSARKFVTSAIRV